MVLSSYVGARVPRKEDPRLITGSATYVDDLHLPGMVHCAFVRSPYAHARITRVDTSAARAMPGVLAVVTGPELLDMIVKIPGTEGQSETEGAALADIEADDIPEPKNPPLATDKVRYVGEEVVAVVAATRYQAEDAVEAVEVEYEPLPVLTDPYAAMQDGAPLLYDDVKQNISVREDRVHGDTDAAFKDAPVVVKRRIRSQRVAPVSMEPRGVVAAPDPMLGGLICWSSTQAPHWNRNDIAEMLGLGQSQVRVIAPEVGGGFGSKIGVYPEDLTVSALAYHLKRPVKWMETRSENFLSTNHGRNQWADIEVAAEKNGKIRGLRANVVLDSGAYPKALDLAWATVVMAGGCYDIENLDYHVVGVYTNTMANGAYRGAGRPEAAYYIERAMDLLADATGLDPVQVRRVNFIRPDKFPYETATGQIYDTGDYEKAINKALQLVGYDQLRQEQAAARQQRQYIGIGVASYVEICGFGPYESAGIRVEPSGAVSVFTGTSPHGQGTETTFAQLVADGLGADYDQIVVHHGDTGNTPQGNGTMGSRSLAVGGAALVRSIEKIRQKATRLAAHMLEAAPEDIELAGGKYRVRGVPDRGVTLAQIADLAYDEDVPAEIGPGLDTVDFFKPDQETYPFGTHVAIVEVNPDTGDIHLRRYVSVDDCGKIISPLLVTGQVHGGLAQGIGQALYEVMHYDAQGELLTGTLNDYVVPKASFFPPFETHHTETTTYINPLGAKGIGEAATIGSTPCVANAVIDALEPFGVTHLDLPFTPEKIWRAIHGGQGSGKGTAHAAD